MRELLIAIAFVLIVVFGFLFPRNQRRGARDWERGWVPMGQRWSILGPAVVFGGGLLYWIVYQMIYGAQ
jgi:hypothetical protein